MKTISLRRLAACLILAGLALAGTSLRSTAQETPAGPDLPDAPEERERIVVVPVDRPQKEPPLFFSAEADMKVRAGIHALDATTELRFRIHQGRPQTLTLGLHGEGEVSAVTGEGLRDWAVRRGADGARFLDIRPDPQQPRPEDSLWRFTVQTRSRVAAGEADIPLPGPSDATTGFSLTLRIEAAEGTDFSLRRAEGLLPLATDPATEATPGSAFAARQAARLRLATQPSGGKLPDLEWLDCSLQGQLAAAASGSGASFRLQGRLRATRAGAKLPVLAGGAALAGEVAGEGWHLALENQQHVLVAERPGEWQVAIDFAVPIGRSGEWRTLDFSLPEGVVVPLQLDGLAADAVFDASLPVVPARENDAWRGYLPADGRVHLAWRRPTQAGQGSLFFTSSALTEARVGGGLLRQSTGIDLRVLQGSLGQLTIDLQGPGEVLSVQGEAILGWSVQGDETGRTLEIRLSRPIEGAATFQIDSQLALGTFPVRTAALRLAPRGALRHSGHLRVANDGAVRIEVTETEGLIQLAPGQFPQPAADEPRQVFVFRHPSAGHAYTVLADQVRPEVSIAEITLHELAETDRRIVSDLELDIREAPLREWEITLPAGYAVVAVEGGAVADFLTLAETAESPRRLRVLFAEPVQGRHLLQLRLERNEAAAAGTWTLPALGFPGAKSHRSFLGAVAAAGYRLSPARLDGLAELPLSFFPKRSAGLQQAFRMRQPDWQAELAVEALGQSIQADVFHLHSLGTGTAYASVVIHYLVIGAPATQWRVAIPQEFGNVDVSGQNVGRDWRLEDGILTVPLTRPLAGAGTLLITCEQPMSDRGGRIAPGSLRPLDVGGERGFIHVVSPRQVKSEIASLTGPVLAADPSELPAEFRLLSSAPTLAAWQYTGADVAIAMDIQSYEPGETSRQVIDFLRLASKVSRDGEWVTTARFFVKSREGRSLRLNLPGQTSLWDVVIEGASVQAREDAGALLLPLPALADPNRPAEIILRYGGRAAKPSRPSLSSPTFEAPVVLAEWVVSSDENHRLRPIGGNAGSAQPAAPTRGWQRLGQYQLPLLLCLTAALASFLLASPMAKRPRRILVLLTGLAATAGCLWLVALMLTSPPKPTETLEFSAPVVAAGQAITLKLAHDAPWRALLGAAFLLPTLAGLALLVLGRLTGIRPAKRLGMAALGAGLLALPGGAAWFLLLLGLLLVFHLIPILRTTIPMKTPSQPPSPPSSTPPAASTTAAILLSLLAWLGGGSTPGHAAQAPPAPLPAAESLVQDWQLREGRLFGSLEITVRGKSGDRFLLSHPPAVLTHFESTDRLRVVKETHQGSEAYFLRLEADGPARGLARLEMPAPDPSRPWTLPLGDAARRILQLTWDEPGWEFTSPQAAAISPQPDRNPAETSAARLILRPGNPVEISLRPLQRDTGSEETRFFAESTQLFLPGPGVVNGRHRIDIRPAQGRVHQLRFTIPPGFTVSEVSGEAAGDWRFDPESGSLQVAVEPSRAEPFHLLVETQRGTAALPVEIDLAPLRVQEAAGEVGLMALAFGEDAQPENIRTEGLAPVTAGDPAADLIPKNAEGHPLAVVQSAYRLGEAKASAQLAITPVAPELRAEIWQLVSLGDDRMVLSADLAVEITRSGIFRIVLELPPALEIESVSGPSLSHWTEQTEDDKRSLILHLAGRTLGLQEFAITLAGSPPAAAADWPVPRLSLPAATRTTGILTVVPDRGLQVVDTRRSHASPVDPRELATTPRDPARAATRPGALAWRLLQADWQVLLRLDPLAPWVTTQIHHHATLREGQMLVRATLQSKIENAAIKSLRVRIPGLDAESAATVRASGGQVADLLPLPDSENTWEIRFPRGIAGENTVELEYQRRTANPAAETIEPVEALDSRQTTTFVSLTPSGRLEISANPPPAGWQRVDFAVVQAALGSRQPAGPPPLLNYRVAQAESPLSLSLKRHNLADLSRLRVTRGTITSLLAPNGGAIHTADFEVRATSKATLRLRLPQAAELIHLFVNEEGANLVREDQHWLFHVLPPPAENAPAALRFAWKTPASPAPGALAGPLLNVPLEQITWRVHLPDGWELRRHHGDFDFQGHSHPARFHLEDYVALAGRKRSETSSDAAALLQQANQWLRQGNQEKAGVALSNAVRNNRLDEASNEDARVQLRQLMTQQAMLGLNTRRQRLTLDNRLATPAGDERLQRAAEANPVLQGTLNFDPSQFDRLLDGNSAEDITALKDIAARIVSQQLAAEPSPAAIDLSLPEHGTVATFYRSVQVDGQRPMNLALSLRPPTHSPLWLGLLACALLTLTPSRPKP